MSVCGLRERNKTKRGGTLDVKVEQMMFQGRSCQKLLVNQIQWRLQKSIGLNSQEVVGNWKLV